jgi:hypothetical protein
MGLWDKVSSFFGNGAPVTVAPEQQASWSAPEKTLDLAEKGEHEAFNGARHDAIGDITFGDEERHQAIQMQNLRDAEELAIINQWADDLQSGVSPEVAESNAVARIEAWDARAPEVGFVYIDLDTVRTAAQQQVQGMQSARADPYSVLLQEHGNMLRAEATRSITTHWTSSLERGADPQQVERWAESRVRQYNANMPGAEIDFATIRDVINDHHASGIKQSSGEVIGRSIRV